MNMVSFFYNIFSKQELILKLNTLNFNKQLSLQKCIVFKPGKTNNNLKELHNVSNDLRYILEFLTNTKINKAINNNFIINLKLNKTKSYNLFLYLAYLVFTRSNFILESKVLEYNYPILQKSNKIKNLINKKYKNYFDIQFKNGLNLPFLSDNEYISWLSSNFYIRFIFKHLTDTEFFFELKQKLFISLIGLKFIIIKKYDGKK